jgi:hypothetical protein
MKPTTLPEGNAWQEWPTLETLQAESGLKISALRAKLAPIACYRCPDKSVRYEPDVARRVLEEATFRAAGFGDLDGDDQDDDDDDETPTGQGAHGGRREQLSMASLFSIALRMLADQRKESATTIRAMQAPLETGLQLVREAMTTQSARLAHLEGVWDRMISVSEDMLSTQANRAALEQKAEHSRALQAKTFAMVKEQLPLMLSKWSLTRQAGLALEFLGDLDPKVVDMVAESGILTPEQATKLEQLRAMMQAKSKTEKPEPDKPHDQNANGKAS